jgi:hypothetical protein
VSITITNLGRHLALCTLNSGRTLHLAPAEVSEPIDPMEINGNAKIERLRRAGLFSIADIDDQRPKREGGPTSETKTPTTPSRRQRQERE